jgi:biopolymer transport protein ExbD
MPIHAAGPRLYRSVPFKYLAQAAHSGVRSSNVALNLTPFVDVMTILVSFLLMVFSASNLITAYEGLELPEASRTYPLQQAPVILVSKTDIVFKVANQAAMVGNVDSVLRDDSPTWKIESLFEVLDAEAKKIQERVREGRDMTNEQRAACELVKAGKRQDPSKALCPEGLAILQADLTTDVRVINKIVNTAKAAGFDHLLFAANKK